MGMGIKGGWVVSGQGGTREGPRSAVHFRPVSGGARAEVGRVCSWRQRGESGYDDSPSYAMPQTLFLTRLYANANAALEHEYTGNNTKRKRRTNPIADVRVTDTLRAHRTPEHATATNRTANKHPKRPMDVCHHAARLAEGSRCDHLSDLPEGCRSRDDWGSGGFSRSRVTGRLVRVMGFDLVGLPLVVGFGVGHVAGLHRLGPYPG